MSRVSPEAFFRSLIIVTLILGAASGVVASFPGDVPEDWSTIMEWHGNGGYYDYIEHTLSPASALERVVWIALLVGLLFLLLGVYVGLFLFWRFARMANL